VPRASEKLLSYCSVVSQGLALTPVASNDDVQDVIATFLRLPEYMMPPAESMQVVTYMQRTFHLGVVLKEISDIVKKTALEGRDRTGLMDLRERSSVKCHVLLQSRRNFTADPDWLQKLFTILRREGYGVYEQHSDSVFFLTWDCE
jgi:hypothetical protein